MHHHVFVQFAHPIGIFHHQLLSPLIPYWKVLADIQKHWLSIYSTKNEIQLSANYVARAITHGVLVRTNCPPNAANINAIRGFGVDINVFDRALKAPRLAIFDMDATLIHEETLDTLAARWLYSTDAKSKAVNKAKEVQQITERAMQGKLSFQQSLNTRLKLLVGMPESVAFDMNSKGVTLHDGVIKCISGMRRQGSTCVIVSGGFKLFAQSLASRLKMDAAIANEWQVNTAHKLTGKLVLPVVNAPYKAFVLITEAKKRGVALADTMAIGDGANDLFMLKAAGLAIAWRGKPIVRKQTPIQINVAPMSALLDWF